MNDIFISYASADRTRANQIADMLVKKGWSVWWDRNIPPGKSFDKVIEEALEATKCILVLWSKESVKSDWVKEEAAEGLRRKIIVPALIDDVRIPFGFRRIQAAQLSDWDGRLEHTGFSQLVESISSIIGEVDVEENGKKKNSSKTEINLARKMQPKWRKNQIVLLLTPIFIIFITLGIYIIKNYHSGLGSTSEDPNLNKSIILRNVSYGHISKEDIQKMLTKKDFYDQRLNKDAPGINHQYKKQKNGKIVFDGTTNLIWQQSESEESMTYNQARIYIKKLNKEKYAGYDDWRLPNLDQTMSLMESERTKNNLFIDPIFNTVQGWIWTADRFYDLTVWTVDFRYGYCTDANWDSIAHVRAVRSDYKELLF